MLIDKGYYDYDYKEPDEVFTVEKHKRTHEQTQAVFSRMGFGKVKKLGDPEPLTAEEMQRIAMEEQNNKV